jgi:hypothetical protein
LSSRLCAFTIPLIVLAGCGQHPTPERASSTHSTPMVSSPAAPSPTSFVAVPPTAAPRTEKWVDLHVGDCVAKVPAVDLGEVTVDTVDCSTPHQAEVYLLAPISVNAALAEVANRACAAGLTPYTGQSGNAFAVTYLIDSRQDRTSDNPLPSTVICLLQAANERPLTGSAHR